MHASDHYSLHSYGRMINDRRRSQPFVDALRRLVGPESVVLEIGTAAGYFALLCAKLGARRIYAVEPDNAIEVAKLCARDVPGSERITWIKGLSTAIELPEKADILLGDLHGTLPFYNHGIESMIDARRRHLKEHGSIVPRRDILRVVPAQAPHEYADVDSPWSGNPEGLDLCAGRSFVVNQTWRARKEPARAEDLLSTPAVWGVVDYRTAKSPDLDGSLQWTVQRAGTMHGYYVWFDGDLGDGIGYSNAPDLPELVYGRAFFPLEQATDVISGDRVETRFAARLLDTMQLFRWDTRISGQDGILKARYRQSTFHSSPVDLEALLRARADHIPNLGVDGRIDQMTLDQMARSRPLREIADALMTAFPEEFNHASKAMQRVARLSVKYSHTTRAPE